jgi:hypothetical protein
VSWRVWQGMAALLGEELCRSRPANGHMWRYGCWIAAKCYLALLLRLCWCSGWCCSFIQLYD